MACFPLFIEMKGKKCLVVGGGEVAFRKASVLVDFGAEVLVVAQEVLPEMAGLAQQNPAVGLLLRAACVRDAEGMDLVFCASDDRWLHSEMAKYCRENRIPVNTADDRELCTFFFPALLRQEDVVIGITTGGSSPAAAKYLRQYIQRQLPLFWGKLAKKLGSFRQLVKESIDGQKEREKLFAALCEIGVGQEGHLTEEIVLEKIEEMQNREKTAAGFLEKKQGWSR